jgi:nucleotide-binding universal stress UspA family protein
MSHDQQPLANPVDPDRPFHPHDEHDAMRTAGEEAEQQPTAAVVVGIDGSEQSRAALLWAMRYATLTGATVEPVAVWHQPVQFSDVPPPPADDFQRQAHQWLAEAVSGSQDSAGDPAPPVWAHIEQGDPSQVLLAYSDRAQLLVLGNHGRGALGAMVLGSVAQRCAHHARCPVLVVPALS